MSNMFRRILTGFFIASGFSGLIYESLWTHYLKLFLGHAAYAQSLVLAIFMGGMAIGAWGASRVSARRADPLRDYAVIEALIGLFALVFHFLFTRATGFAFNVLLPLAGEGAAAEAVRWGLAGLLILPQSILLGMTFPLMVAGVLRRRAGHPGNTVATLYFANSLGGVVGVLASGFLLIGWLGLPGTMYFAAAVNLAIASGVACLARHGGGKAATTLQSDQTERAGRIMLATALITGATSFAYEIGWIRLLSMVLGASTHAFEVMLAAFIAGLAIGGLIIRSQIDRLKRPLIALALAQIGMGLLAAATLPLAGYAFHALSWLMRNLPHTDAGFHLINLGGLAISMALMLPTTILAGMTLPLVTLIILRAGKGEASVGAVYASNTIGAIVGVMLSLHLVMPAAGIEGLILGGGTLDVLLGLVLLMVAGEPIMRLAGGAVVAGGALLGMGASGKLDQNLLASGVYRDGSMSARKQVVTAHRDGKTATIQITREGEILSIRTNGKPDASVAMGVRQMPTLDEATMVMLGALPEMLKAQLKTVANIGFGSGITTHTLLASASTERVDTIEIEAEVATLARAFGSHNSRAYSDPRSLIHFDDAKAFFAYNAGRYDVIISEPSNPWVSGVSGLFSSEFYTLARKKLAAGGMLVQWLQLYEIEPKLVASVLMAMGEQFPHYAIFSSNNGDLIIAASEQPLSGAITPDALTGKYTALLGRAGVSTQTDVAIRFLGDRKVWEPLVLSYRTAANSDYDPVLDQGAARSRFLKSSAVHMPALKSEPLPVLEMLSGMQVGMAGPVTPGSVFSATQYFSDAQLISERLSGRSVALPAQAAAAAAICDSDDDALYALLELSFKTLAYLPPAQASAIVARARTMRCGRTLAAQAPGWLDLMDAVAARDARAMATQAQSLLAADIGLTPSRRRYLLAAALLGSVAGGEGAQAMTLLSRYDSVIGDGMTGLLFPMLKSHAQYLTRRKE